MSAEAPPRSKPHLLVHLEPQRTSDGQYQTGKTRRLGQTPTEPTIVFLDADIFRAALERGRPA